MKSKHKALLTMLVSAALIIAVGCGNNNNTNNETADTITPSETHDETSADGNAGNSQDYWYLSTSMGISEGVYIVGEDILPGNYGISTDDAVSYAIFESVEKYLDYHKSSRFTHGEENDAIDANAKIHEYVYNSQTEALNLTDKEVLLVKRGPAFLEFSDPPAELSDPEYGNAKKLYDGVYKAPADLEEGSYFITAVDSCRIAVFLSDNDYEKFENEDHFTNGEYGSDLERNAFADYYINEGETCYVHVKSGNILMVHNGEAVIQKIRMNWTVK